MAAEPVARLAAAGEEPSTVDRICVRLRFGDELLSAAVGGPGVSRGEGV